MTFDPYSSPPTGARRCGIPRIDGLFTAAPVSPVTRGDADQESVGAIQDLLAGHGYRGLPCLTSSAYGAYGQKTAEAVRDFQSAHGLAEQDAVDTATLRALVAQPPADPRASRAYLGLALGFPYRGLNKVLCLVAQMEGMGRFAALNLNTDGAGLSFGIIQWAQRPGRLAEILGAFAKATRDQFARIFGPGDPSQAERLLAHVDRPGGGVDPASGVAEDPDFDLVQEPWVSRFRQAALHPPFQQVQVQTALAALQRSRDRLRRFAPSVCSERGIAFLLDVANQFGDAGLERLCGAVSREGIQDRDWLQAIAGETVERMPDRFKSAVRQRRDTFLETPLLLDQPFADSADSEPDT